MANEKDIFTKHYASLCSTLTDVNNLLPHFVQEKIITINDEEEIDIIKTTPNKVKKLLSHISGPLESGDTEGFHVMLAIMKEQGSKSTKGLAVKMSREVIPPINKTEREATDNNDHNQQSKQEPTKRSSNTFAIQFSMLLANIGCLLDGKCSDKLEKCKQFCCGLKVSDESSELLFDDKQLKEINQCHNFHQLFASHLHFHLNWEQYFILESIIALTELKEAEDELDKYKKYMASKMGMKIISDTIDDHDLPQNSIKLSIIVDKPYTKLTAGEYIELKDFICTILKIRKYVAYPYIKFFFESLHLEWYIPVQAARYMIKTAASLNISLFLQQSVVILKVGDEVLFDCTVKQGNPSNCRSGGYEYRFVDTPPDRLVCNICHLPCREVQQSECCGHIYCKGDINLLKATTPLQLACPMCRAKDFVTYPNLEIDREIQQLMVYCPDKDISGCDWIGKLKDVDKHYSDGRECETECEKCKTTVKHKLLRTHLDTECPCYCPYCHFTAEREVISSEHKEKCHKFPLTCPNNCGLDNIPRDNMDEHKKECPLEVIQCEFHDIGCEVIIPRKDEESHSRDSVTAHLQLAQRRLTILNKMLEDSNARHLESSEKFTVLLSELQEKIRTFEEVHTNQSAQSAKAQSVDVEVQTDVNPVDMAMATSTFGKICQYFVLLRNSDVPFLTLIVLVIILSYVNHNRVTTTSSTSIATNYTLPTVQEFHEKVSVVLYELINQSTLSWPNKLCYWSDTATIVTPVVVKFSEFSKQKLSILHSSTFFGFTNGYLMRLRIYPSGSSGIGTKGSYMSVYLVFMKGPHDDTLEKLGYFPINKSFTVELLNPTDDDSHVQKEILPYSKGCNVSRVAADDNISCGFPHFVPLGGYNFKQKCTCNKTNVTLCCYLMDDDTLYFRVQEGKQKS